VVNGSPTRKSFAIDEALHKHVTASGERRVSVREDGKKAVTKVEVLKAGKEFSLLQVRLLTGRTHQIRVHLAHAGHPVLGDDKYGDFALNRSLGRTRLFLHATKLALRHPLTGAALRFEAPLPREMSAFIDASL
jgi:23S rRNA pseudouridine955/2504/2580 synthase